MMDTIFYLFSTTFPTHLAVIIQYWEYPWRSKRAAIGLACLNLTIKLIVINRVLQAGGNGRLLEIVFSLFGVSIYLVCIRTDCFKQLFTYVLLMDYLLIVRGIASFTGVRLFNSAQGWQSAFISLIIYFINFPLLFRFSRRFVRLAGQISTPALWRTIWLMPALASILVIYSTNMYDSDSAGSLFSLCVRLGLLVFIIITCFLLVHAMESLQHLTILEEQNRQIQRILALQRAQYATMQVHMAEIRRARHDLRQHQNIIRTYLKTGDLEPLREYLKVDIEPDASEVFHPYCANYPVNTLLNYYADLCRNSKIEFSFQAELPEKIAVAEPDFCVILGNLLENALDSCRCQTGAHIEVAARCSAGRSITLTVDNSAPEAPQQKSDGSFASSKHEEAGIGIRSVQYIARQYHGTADFRWKDGIFQASVFLNPDASVDIHTYSCQ